MKYGGVFITGTDTGIGKTLIAAGLARLLVNRGMKVGVFKPVASDYAKASSDRSGGLMSEDGKLLLKAAKLPNSAYPGIVPVHYLKPLAPYVAGWKEGAVPLKKIEQAYWKGKASCDFLIVEGVGGIQVPITQKFFVTDWMKKWKLPVLVVARAGLGTINHTLLTVEALQKRKIKVLGVVVNGYKGKTVAEKTNVKALKKLLKVPVYGPVKFNPKYRANLDLLAKDLSRLGLKF